MHFHPAGVLVLFFTTVQIPYNYMAHVGDTTSEQAWYVFLQVKSSLPRHKVDALTSFHQGFS